jgi:hypothetical protein
MDYLTLYDDATRDSKALCIFPVFIVLEYSPIGGKFSPTTTPHPVHCQEKIEKFPNFCLESFNITE